jgi:Cu(I)/Ag(I) efflux system membrane fusion protein
MLANIKLQTDKKKSLTLPVDAIIQDSKGANVWVQDSDGIFENKMVKTGMQNSRSIEIIDGLVEGDLVVVTGAYLLNSEYVFKKGANPMEGHGHKQGDKQDMQDLPGMKM